MALTLQQVQQLAHELPLDEQMLLANSLLEEIGTDAPDAFAGDDAAWDAEISRRVEEIKAGTAETLSLEEFEESMRSTLDE
jgi:putative addiction module component (TIGR02574 family)